MKIEKLLDALFGSSEEMNGGERCPTYLFRWTSETATEMKACE
jgi:hypothetical protein